MDPSKIFCSDRNEPPTNIPIKNHIKLDATDPKAVQAVIDKHNITQIYCLPALLSFTGEKDPPYTNYVNMQALFVTL